MISNVAVASEIWVKFYTYFTHKSSYYSYLHVYEIFWGVDELQHINIKYLQG